MEVLPSDIFSLKGGFFGFFLFMYDIHHCFICRPSDSTVSKDAGIEPRTVATTALAVRRSNHSAGSHPHSARSHPSEILSLSSQRGRYRTTRLQAYRVQEYGLPSPPSFKCNVLRKSLFEDCQNIPLRNTKEKGVVGNLMTNMSRIFGPRFAKILQSVFHINDIFTDTGTDPSLNNELGSTSR